MSKENFYEILGVKSDATIKQINKAYKKLAMRFHPDKLNGLSDADKKANEEHFKLINHANETLSNPEKRKLYDNKVQADELTLDDDVPNLDLRQLTSMRQPFSTKFRRDHAAYLNTFSHQPLRKEDVSSLLKFYYCDIYQDQIHSDECQNIFTLVKLKKNWSAKPFIMTDGGLTPATAFELFLRFLKGEFYGKNLHIVIDAFDQAAQKVKDKHEFNLYEGMKDILVFGVIQPKVDDALVRALQKITDYIKRHATTNLAMCYMAPLLQSSYFRHLFSLALHLYWISDVNITDELNLKKFNGEEQAKDFFEKLKEKNFVSNNKNDASLIRYVRVLFRFEKAINQAQQANVNSNDNDYNQSVATLLREKAFLILDWVGALIGHVRPGLIANSFFQAGIYFQKAAQIEEIPAKQMADEKSSLSCYLVAMELGRHAKPDFELYIHTHGIKCILGLKYAHEDIAQIVKALQQKALIRANVYPFFQGIQSNIDFFKQEDEMLVTMRQLLHTLVGMMEYNQKSKSNKNPLDHEYVLILKEAFEACLQDWYHEKHNPEEEKAFRLKLMLELLSINRWTFTHIKTNLQSPLVQVNRDSKGWMLADRSLSFSSEKSDVFFRSINGIEIDDKTGQIKFNFEPASENSSHSKLISAFDLQQLLALQVTSALFSLDQPDADHRFHPFQKMRFIPERIYYSQLQQSMLDADYLLKFFTTGWEVQAKEPFDMREISVCSKKLPAHIKKIFDDYRSTKSQGMDNVHRFWIQAEEITYSEEHLAKSTIALGHMRMVVYKHRMVCDMNGKLIDTEERGEGWNFYFMNKQQLNKNIKKIESPAMIWTGNNTVCLFEDSQLSKEFVIQKYDQHLSKLIKLNRDSDQKVILENNIDAIETVYRATREIAKQVKIDHHFSPEYILARELTRHYDELALYFPELGRLRELSKAVSVVGILERHRLNNVETIKKMNERIAENDVEFWNKIEKKIKKQVANNVRTNFENWGQTFSNEHIREQEYEKIKKIWDEIKNWNPIKRVSEIRAEFNQNAQNQGFSIYDSQVTEAWNKQQKMIESAALKQRADLQKQLKKIFSDALQDNSSADQITNKFLDGYSDPLLECLVTSSEEIIKTQIQNIFPQISKSKLWRAVHGDEISISEVIANQMKIDVEKEKENVKSICRQQINKCSRHLVKLEELGLKEEKEEFDLEGICLWVPASIHHEIENNCSSLVYGGVQVAANLRAANSQQQGLMLAQATRGQQAQFNRVNGNAFRDQWANNFRAMGCKVDTEVHQRTIFGSRFVDIRVTTPDGQVHHVETKFGPHARYNSSQLAKDNWTRMFGGPNGTPGPATTVIYGGR